MGRRRRNTISILNDVVETDDLIRRNMDKLTEEELDRIYELRKKASDSVDEARTAMRLIRAIILKELA